ncbi:NADH-ubiquinone oxidoreductase 20.9 kDa subunit-like protein [Hapsidospora chrysogenum ATCC 11550]|uniref:NADH-ubiquinone oxidoreductase 20.9 kDa subunit-like protein n=1 Tax=Hapsidospora chrysogenum (strain ATCC 11550 / CBS 779.69 / DSM 880 / IAM 14645 / JCM 23072 / IMI 49137) TaxID=857340 RepID=A0A086SZN0_HAPC1|nr:NADH-ubiquinone oxidoreductase 20.9 kDa subunit-like protein [Hapsidospora chrysogenum ATCC 11550]
MADNTTKQAQPTYTGPTKALKTDYPRVVGYARKSDYVVGGLAAAFAPAAMLVLERFAPSHAGKGGFPKIMRLATAIGLTGGFLIFYQRSSLRFYGATENAREREMDMREMVDKVKRGESLYGESQLTPHMQGVAARQSRYSALFMGVVPWFNFVNHNQHGVDTAKYYQQAERELEAERQAKA